MDKLLNFLSSSLSPYHAVKNVEDILFKNGFEKLNEDKHFNIEKGKKYFVTRNDSSLIAFYANDNFKFNIASAHTDSPCLKIKGNPVIKSGNCVALNTEVYGGPILNSFFDRRLTLAGRVFCDSENSQNRFKVESKLFTSDFNVVIPNVAIHLNREVNSGVKLNAQVDTQPLLAIGDGDFANLLNNALSHDIFVVCAEKGYTWGQNDEFFSSPRIDDLAGVFASLTAFLHAKSDCINMLAIFDNEEIGSKTRQGAASTFLMDIMRRIAFAFGHSDEQLLLALAHSVMLSVDNAHASHPAHTEYDDPTNKTVLGAGLAIKHNAKFNYTTDAKSAAYLKKLFNKAGVKYQDYYVKSDISGGSTLGIVSSAPVSILSADIGLPQLAMHSAVETACKSDYLEFVSGIKAFFNGL